MDEREKLIDMLRPLVQQGISVQRLADQILTLFHPPVDPAKVERLRQLRYQFQHAESWSMFDSGWLLTELEGFYGLRGDS